jgi:predicted amidohydrolase YtcJ
VTHRTTIGFVAAVALGLPALLRPAAAQPPAHVERIFVNGVLWTADEAKPRAEAMAIAGDRIVAVGNDAEIRALADENTAVTDLGGRFVVPGFQDSHVHFPGPSVNHVEGLLDIETLEAFQEILRDFARAHPDLPWIVGQGWGYSIFPEQIPDKKYIDAVIFDRPVYIVSRDGHMGLANSKALEVAGITRETPDPPNGLIMRLRSGEPNGEFKEAAEQLIQAHIPPDTPEVQYESFVHHMGEMAKHGLTAAQDAMTMLDRLPMYVRAVAAGDLKVRIRLAPWIVPGVGPYSPTHKLAHPVTEQDVAPYLEMRDTFRGPLVKMVAVKGVVDGTVDAQTAVMFEPYVGTMNTGIPFWEPGELNRTVALYDKLGFQLLLHAIGDRAVSDTLDALAYARATNGTSGRRHRIEHAEVTRLEDLGRFRELEVIASTQAMFANPDATVLENFDPLLGPERAPIADSFSLFDDAGIVQAFGSDWPNFNYLPLRGIFVAVNRTTPEGEPPGGWHPKGRISVEAALRHYTIDGAFATFDEGTRGSLSGGKLADFVVLSKDLRAIPPEQILSAEVLLTVMGGRETFRSQAF